ncbi:MULTISPECIES: hypothetical protein [unclassified Streptomyces]|uniref:hypothetical protein n=1 Tax=unclassified Streptomyces TaxID=2593676 RepID=UPI0036EEB0FD
MLRIIDDRTGDPVPVRRGLTRVEAHVPGYDTSALRVLLVADVLARALELGGAPVWSVLRAERDEAELRAGVAALGIRPFESGRDAGAGPGEGRVIHVVGAGGATPDGVRVAVAPVARADGGGPGPEGAAHAAAPEPAVGADPGDLRLALLSHRHDLPVRLDAAALDDAHATLARWRRTVAGWARQPSRPVPEEVRDELQSAWEDDLDVPGVLRVLRRVETADLPEGARFETYAYADRLLGLELTRDLGAP